MEVQLIRRWLPLLLLLTYGLAFAWQIAGRGLPAYDDHPGQYFRLWYALERSWPEERWIIDWNPYWWAGYPELQFYPPGFVLLGLALKLLTFGWLSTEAVYRALVAGIYLLPGIGLFFLTRTLVPKGWYALPSAFLALTLSAGLKGGVEEGVRWGMIGSRLAIGLLPLLLLSLQGWRRPGYVGPAWTGFWLAAIVLAHPYHAPLGFLVGGIYALSRWRRGESGRRPLCQAIVALVIGVGLPAFWLLPLLVRKTYATPLLWGISTPDSFGRHLLAYPVFLLLALAYLGAWRRSASGEGLPSITDVFRWTPLAFVALWGVDALLVLYLPGFGYFDPMRLWDGLVYLLLPLVGIGIVKVLNVGRSRGRGRIDRSGAVSFIGILLIFASLVHPGDEPALMLWPAREDWPSLDELSRRHHLPKLWEALRNGPPGRVLFATSRLNLRDEEVWYAPHSHLFALAPIWTGREIINGTFTHPSPLAATFYAGTERPGAILTLVEQLDGHHLFGRPTWKLTPHELESLMTPLAISTVVADEQDPHLKALLQESGQFRLADRVGGLLVFHRTAPAPMALGPEGQPLVMREKGGRQFTLIGGETAGGWLTTALAAYPLWTATAPGGPLATREGPGHLLQVRVPPALSLQVTLLYREGWPEQVGKVASFLTLLLWVPLAWLYRGKPV